MKHCGERKLKGANRRVCALLFGIEQCHAAVSKTRALPAETVQRAIFGIHAWSNSDASVLSCPTPTEIAAAHPDREASQIQQF